MRQSAAYDLVHENAIGEIRKIVVHDGHSGPKRNQRRPEFLPGSPIPN